VDHEELTVSEARRYGLPDQDPINGEPVVWAPIRKETPAQDVRSIAQFEAAGAILGDGAAA
jgi:hypothetical protein